jgi:hypothetical protein
MSEDEIQENYGSDYYSDLKKYIKQIKYKEDGA